MRAALFDRFGAAHEVLRIVELPAPVAGPGEVLVRVKASGVNPSDVKKRAGAFPDLLDKGPVVPHSDGSGVIESVGPGVDRARVGERVWIYQAQYERRMGTAADHLAIDGARAVPLPEHIGWAVGASLGIPAMTAHRCVFADGPVAGTTVLVTGGAGRVGHYAIQWAHQAGARVIATASRPADRTACLEAGAEAVVDHRQPDWWRDVTARAGGRVDRVVEVALGANLEQILQVIRVGGTIATYASADVSEPRLPFLRMLYMDLTIQMVLVYAMPEAAKLQAITDLNVGLCAESLIHRVAVELPLDDIARAHSLVEEGAVRGSVIVTLDG